jgi:formylglycine-generating enzyme required for sulfatase activity
MWNRPWVAVLLLGLGVSCSMAPESLPPYGQVVVHVDTDLPAPAIAGRVRIDLFDASGRWFDSRDLARPNPDDWPLSFGVWVQENESRDVWVRLRAYPEGKVRDYRGERYQDWPDVLTGPADGGGEPRLIRDGEDLTPTTEPEPLVTVDRLVLLRIPREEKRHAEIVLHGACSGTMVHMAAESEGGPAYGEAMSCVDAVKVRELVEPWPLVQQAPAGESLGGSWNHQPCDAESEDDRVCIPGGAMLLGSRRLLMADYTDAAPERLVALDRFWIDRREVSVGDFRAALNEGFTPPALPEVGADPLPDDVLERCTFTPVVADRESYPLNCVTWETARAYCRFREGELLTEAQWEYVATTAGHPRKVPYPWGDTEPDCGSVVFSRVPFDTPAMCEAQGPGPVTIGEGDVQDASPQGVSDLAGGVSEWTLDVGLPYTDPCWAEQIVNPRCAHVDIQDRSVRGGSWSSPMPMLVGTFRLALPARATASFVGFRCVKGAT